MVSKNFWIKDFLSSFRGTYWKGSLYRLIQQKSGRTYNTFHPAAGQQFPFSLKIPNIFVLYQLAKSMACPILRWKRNSHLERLKKGISPGETVLGFFCEFQWHVVTLLKQKCILSGLWHTPLTSLMRWSSLSYNYTSLYPFSKNSLRRRSEGHLFH